MSGIRFIIKIKFHLIHVCNNPFNSQLNSPSPLALLVSEFNGIERIGIKIKQFKWMMKEEIATAITHQQRIEMNFIIHFIIRFTLFWSQLISFINNSFVGGRNQFTEESYYNCKFIIGFWINQKLQSLQLTTLFITGW